MLRILRQAPTIKRSSRPMRVFSGMLLKYHRNRFARLIMSNRGRLTADAPDREAPMNKLLLAATALIGFAAINTANAADLALKAPPPPLVVDEWTGGYIGLNLGGS
jgi:hypothetical protein